MKQSIVTFSYDNADRRVSATLSNGIEAVYGYSDANQLETLVFRLGQTALGDLGYAYDSLGRRHQTSRTLARTALPQSIASATYDAVNKLSAWGEPQLSYDATGNLASDGPTSYVWNARGQLTSMTGSSVVSFGHDALRRRATESAGTDARSYLYDRFEVAAEL